jgi:rubrerythrin
LAEPAKEAPRVFVCQVCGHIAEDHAPDECPICGAKSQSYKEII